MDEERGSRIAGPPDESVLAINFVADAGRQMLESSSSVSEVIARLRRFLPAVGLEGCSIDANLSSLILSYWKPELAIPITTMRDVRVGEPRLERLSGTDALLDQVERGQMGLAAAYDRLRVLERSPGVRRRSAGLATLVSVTGWVLFLNGVDAATVLVALLASALTLPTDLIVDRLRLPSVTSTFLSALILAAVPNLVAAAGLSLKVGPAVVGGLFLYLPGRALVSSVIDGLSNAPLSAMARGVQAIVAAGALAIGMLVGSRIGAGLGLHYRPDLNAVPLVITLLGAAVGMFGLAVAWAMPRVLLVPTLAIGAGGWLVVSLMTSVRGVGTDWAAYALGAALVGLSGVLIAALQGSSASIYTGVAILPLVPGFTLYRGVLALSQGKNAIALTTLGEAAIISLAIAVGVAFGLAFGRNLLAVGNRLRRHRGSTGQETSTAAEGD